MNRYSFELLGVLAALSGAAVACKDTPVASNGVGTPTKIVADYSKVTFNGIGKQATVTARVVDNTNTPLSQTISVATCNSGVVTAVPNAVQPVPPTALTTTVTSTGLNSSCFVYSSNGVAPDTVAVVVLPTAFPGAVSSTTPQGGSTLVIHSTATLKFNPATVTVTFPAGATTEAGVILGASADSVALLVPFGSNGAATITGIKVTYVAGLEVALPTAANIVQTGNFWAASNSWQTAPDITSLLPASGGTSQMIVGLPTAQDVSICPEVALGAGSTGPCAMFKFTVAAPTTINFTVSWEGTASNPDVDIYACSDSTVANFGAACFEDGGHGATGSLPQSTGNFTYPVGTHYFVIENYCSGDPAEVHCVFGSSPNNFVTITAP